MVNPATTKRNKENRDNSPSKNDPKDALVIADAVSRGFYTNIRVSRLCSSDY
ncbi:transposase [Paenibacillus sp. L3-i20]|uniref:transposase n=1 Tax=Paenibacillus sp. L3-i20 TaxID=2905833 RepID=UPI001EDEC59C